MKIENDDSYYDEETYSKGLSREDTIEKQVRLVAYHYSKGMWTQFEYSLHMLIALLPRDVRTRFKPIYIDAKSFDVISKHFEQFVDIQLALEEDTNMIFKRKFIKTFE